MLTVVAIAALALLLGDVVLSLRDARYDNLIRNYECSPCAADFDGDGVVDTLTIDERHDTPIKSPPQIIVDAPEMFRLKGIYIDNTLRTHMAVRRYPGGARLLIWEGVQTEQTPRQPVSVVYALGAGKLAKVEPTALDREILSAMAARDDAGSWNRWVAYHLLMWPVRIIYGALFILAAVLYREYERTGKPLP